MIAQSVARIASRTRHYVSSRKTVLPTHASLRRLVARSFKDRENKRPTGLTSEKTEGLLSARSGIFFLRHLGIKEANGVLSFSVDHRKVATLVCMSAVNRNIAIQLCQYLCLLSRKKSLYIDETVKMMEFLLKNRDGLHLTRLCYLVVDVAKLSHGCLEKCSQIILNDRELAEKLPNDAVRELFIACYKNDDWTTANRLYDKFAEDRIDISEKLIDALTEGLLQTKISSCDHSNSRQPIRVPNSIHEHLVRISNVCRKTKQELISKDFEKLVHALAHVGYQASSVNDFNGGRCSVCKSSLPLYDKSQNLLLNKRIGQLITEHTDRGLYINMRHSEIGSLEKFISDLFRKDKRPLDLVLDGLNIASCLSGAQVWEQQQLSSDIAVHKRRANKVGQGQNLTRMILHNKLHVGKRVLVVGKEYMQCLPGVIDFFDEYGIEFFLTSRKASDDLVQIYMATLHPRTILVTNDFLRDHLDKMPDVKSKTLFKRWFETSRASYKLTNLNLNWPDPFDYSPVFDKAKSIFHWPVFDGIGRKDQLTVFHPHGNHRWICFKSKDKS